MPIKKEFLVNRQGKDFVLYAGLLDAAHQDGLKRISTKLIQAPTEENFHTSICWAEVETAKGTFTGIGDANPQNVGRMIAMHCIRMSETRAKARALRDAVNVGVTALEELADADEDGSDDAPIRRTVNTERAAIGLQPHSAQAVLGSGQRPTKPIPTPAGPPTKKDLLPSLPSEHEPMTVAQRAKILFLTNALGGDVEKSATALENRDLNARQAADIIISLTGRINDQTARDKAKDQQERDSVTAPRAPKPIHSLGQHHIGNLTPPPTEKPES